MLGNHLVDRDYALVSSALVVERPYLSTLGYIVNKERGPGVAIVGGRNDYDFFDVDVNETKACLRSSEKLRVTQIGFY